MYVNGETSFIGQKADPKVDEITVDGRPLALEGQKRYLMLNKPRGYVCTLSDEKGRPTVAELVKDCGERVYPVGRLDLDSEGLLLLTNDGEWMQHLLHPRYEVNKVYEVSVAGEVRGAAEALASMTQLDGEPTRPAQGGAAREGDPTKTCVLTIGQFMAGTAANIIPDTAVLRGTIRTNDKKARALLVRRMRETAERTAAVYNATVEIRTLSEVCPLVCDKSVTDDMLRYMGALNIPNFTPYGGISATGSEDFALVAERVPSAMMYLGAGYMDERGQYTAHNPKVVFNEGVLPIGAACMAHCAVEWLKENA